MIVKLLTEHPLEFLSLNRGCVGSSESTLVKRPHCWKSHALAQMILLKYHIYQNLMNWPTYIIRAVVLENLFFGFQTRSH